MDERQQLRTPSPSARLEPASTEPFFEAVSSNSASGFADLEAAVELVRCGLATRVTLANFASWPGLLWQAYQLSVETGLQILATAPHGEGQLDIVVYRESDDERA